MIENIRTSNLKNRDIRKEFLEKEIGVEESIIEDLLNEKKRNKVPLRKAFSLMNHISPLLTRKNLLSYCKDSVEELQRFCRRTTKRKKEIKNLEWLRDHTEPWSPSFWSILIRIRNAQENVQEAKESLVVYQEQLDIMNIG